MASMKKTKVTAVTENTNSTEGAKVREVTKDEHGRWIREQHRNKANEDHPANDFFERLTSKIKVALFKELKGISSEILSDEVPAGPEAGTGTGPDEIPKA